MPLYVRDVEAYVALTGPKIANFRSVFGYALTRTPVVPNFSLSAQASLLASFNRQYNTTFTASQALFDTPAALSNDDLGYNSTVMLRLNRTSGYAGSKKMRYSRWTIATAFIGKDATQLPSGLGTTIYGSLSAINTKFGLALTTDDVVDGAIATGATGFTLTVSSTSIYFVPGTAQRIGAV